MFLRLIGVKAVNIKPNIGVTIFKAAEAPLSSCSIQPPYERRGAVECYRLNQLRRLVH